VSTPDDPVALDALCSLLRAHAIDTIFVHVGPADGAGRIPQARAPYAESFAAAFHAGCPGVRLLAWIGQLLPAWDGELRLTDATVRADLANTARTFMQEGFDGVQIDLEPVADGDPAFLDLLRRLRVAIGDRWLAVAAPSLRLTDASSLPGLRLPLTPWSAAYYARIGALADEIDPMLYVTSLRTPVRYTRFIAEEAHALVALLQGVIIRPGLPVFAARNPYFDDNAENLTAGLAGLAAAFPAQPWPPALAGVALYPLWSITGSDWASLDRWMEATHIR
jgi:hypothetical protein